MTGSVFQKKWQPVYADRGATFPCEEVGQNKKPMIPIMAELDSPHPRRSRHDLDLPRLIGNSLDGGGDYSDIEDGSLPEQFTGE
jgi:hypothetical protein